MAALIQTFNAVIPRFEHGCAPVNRASNSSYEGIRNRIFDISSEPWMLDDQDVEILRHVDDRRSRVGKPIRPARPARKL